MDLRWRIVLLALASALALVMVAALALGVRLTGSASGDRAGAPLLRPRFNQSPQLRLGVLSSGRLPGGLPRAWRRAADDGRVDLTELRGRPVVVNFWASWCDPCRREAPLLQRVWQAERGRVLVLGVNQDDRLGDARGFMRRFAVTYPSVRESGDATARRWGVGGFPATFFIAADGHAVAQTIGQLHPGPLERGIAAARNDRSR